MNIICFFGPVKRQIIYFILVVVSMAGYAQSVVRGKVVNAENENIGFCHVYNITMGLGKVADINGLFSLTARKGDTLKFSYVGYQSLEIPVKSIHVVNFIKVTLPEDTIELPSITIYADPNYRVPLSIQGEPLLIPGLSLTEKREPIKAGDIRPGAGIGPGGIPGGGATIYGPITYFSKDEKEKRKAEEAREETAKTITYQKFIAQDSVSAKLCMIYKLDSAQYDEVIIRLHQQFPGIQRSYRPTLIWNWLLTHFDRTVPLIKNY